MGFWNALKGALRGAARTGEDDDNALWVYVRCAKCGEPLRTRVDLHNDLSPTEEEAGYFTRKTIIGGKRCFNPVEVEITFDENRRPIDRTIQGGTFIAPDDYHA